MHTEISKTAVGMKLQWASDLYRRRATIRQAKAHRRLCEGLELDAMIEEVRVCKLLESMQKPAEILGLLEIVKTLQPRSVLEIGACGGGTLSMFCQVADPSAEILSLDINFDPIQLSAYPYLAREGQRLTCLSADTHRESTREEVVRRLSGRMLDFLFIDGDHSFEGVSCDFRMYAPLVRDGGVIGFHDIVPDFKTRYGTATSSDVGEVPAFWADLKAAYPVTRDLVEDPLQDGYGIGVLWWDHVMRV